MRVMEGVDFHFSEGCPDTTAAAANVQEDWVFGCKGKGLCDPSVDWLVGGMSFAV
jgi:hypothetical protein